MAQVKPTNEQWAVARLAYESDPAKSYADIGKILGVSKQSVYRKATADGWQKRLSNEEAADRAYQVADGVKKTTNAHGMPEFGSDRYDSVTANRESVTAVAVEDAVAKRAEILQRHRTEANGVRKLVYDAIKNGGDGEKAKTAKAAAEAMRITQEMERKSWGLENADKTPPPVVIIDRERRRRRDA